MGSFGWDFTPIYNRAAAKRLTVLTSRLVGAGDRKSIWVTRFTPTCLPARACAVAGGLSAPSHFGKVAAGCGLRRAGRTRADGHFLKVRAPAAQTKHPGGNDTFPEQFPLVNFQKVERGRGLKGGGV